MAVSPDGKTLASAGSYPSDVCLWDVATGKRTARFLGEEDPFLLAFSADGKTLISVDESAIVRFRTVADGKEVRRLQVVENNKDWDAKGALSPDGRYLAVRDVAKGGICLWDLTARKEVRRFKIGKDAFGPIAVSLDGKTIAADDGAAGYQIGLWDVASGKKRTCSYNPSYLGALCFSRDGKTLGSAGMYHKNSLWDVSTGKKTHSFALAPRATSALGFSPDGKLLATTNAFGTMSVWDIAANREMWKSDTGGRGITTIVFSPDGRLLFTAAEERVIRLWEVAGGKEVTPLATAQGSPGSLVSSADGKFLASSSWADGVAIWDAKSSKQLYRFKSTWVGAVAFTPDSKRFAYTHEDYTVRLCDIATGKERARFQGDFEKTSNEVTALAFAADSRTLFTSHADIALRAWDVAHGKRLRHDARESPNGTGTTENAMRYHYFSPDARLLMTLHNISTEFYSLWNTSDGRRIKLSNPLSQRLGNQIAMAPDGRIFAVWSRENTLSVHEVLTGAKRWSVRLAPSDGVLPLFAFRPLAFASDGRLLATASRDDESIDVWDAAVGKRVHRIEAVQGHLSGLAFVGQGDLLATGGSDTTILLWDLSEVRRRMRLPRRGLSANDLSRLWKQLGSDQPHQAIWKLVAGGKATVNFLRKRLRPAQERLPKKNPEIVLTPDQIRAQRALEVLEHIGTAEAREFVQELTRAATGE